LIKIRKKLNFDSDLHIDLLEMQGDNSVLSPHVSVSSENSAKAPTENYSFDEKKSLFTDDDVQRLLTRLTLSFLVISHTMSAVFSPTDSRTPLILTQLFLLCCSRSSSLDLFFGISPIEHQQKNIHLMKKNLCSPTMMYSDLQWPLKISCLMTCVRNSDKICICVIWDFWYIFCSLQEFWAFLCMCEPGNYLFMTFCTW
jgi:hypothetical protein